MADALSYVTGVGGLASNIGSNIINGLFSSRQQDFAEYQYRDMKRYNSMPAQVQRMRAAGMNPAFMNGALQAGQASAVSQPAPVPMQPLDLSGLASLQRGIQLNDVEREKTEAESQLTKLRSINQDFDNFLQQTFGVAEKQGALTEQAERIRKLISEALLNAADKNYKKALEQLSRAQEFFYYAAGGKEHQLMLNAAEQFKWISKNAEAYIRHLMHQDNNLDAQNDNLYAQADMFDSQSRLNDSLSDLNEYDFQLKDDPEVRAALQGELKLAREKVESHINLTKQQKAHLDALTALAEKDNDTYYVRLFLDYMVKIGATLADIVSLKKKLGAFEALAGAAGKNAETRAAKEDRIGSKVEETNTYTYDKNGKPKIVNQKQKHYKAKRK